MLERFVKNEDSPKKKIFSVKNYDLINSLIGDDAKANATTESNVFETNTIEKYLNNDVEDFAWAVANNLYTENGISKTLGSVYQHYIAFPKKANDSLLDLIRFHMTMEFRCESRVNGKEQILHHFLTALNQYTTELRKYAGDLEYRFKNNSKELDRVSSSDLTIPEDIINYISSQPEIINKGKYLANLISLIIQFWNVGDNHYQMKNWAAVYKILFDITELSEYDNYPEYRNKLVYIIKNIHDSDYDNPTYNTAIPVLTNLIPIKGKMLKTTSDAVVLKTDMSLRNDEFTHADRIIHGPEGTFTKRPYILLYRDSDIRDIGEITRKIVEEYARDEFINPYEAYAVQILHQGMYYDERIKWETV